MAYDDDWYCWQLENRLGIQVTDDLLRHAQATAQLPEVLPSTEKGARLALELLDYAIRDAFKVTGHPLESRKAAPMLPPNSGVTLQAAAAGTSHAQLTLEGGVPEEPHTLREQAISRLVAQTAGRDTAVLRFRRDVLAEGTPLSSAREMQAWINRQAEQEQQVGGQGAPTGLTLTYALGGVEQDQPDLAPGGVLDRLRQLSQTLAPRYGWTAAQAATFVLTGEAPLIHDMEASSKLHPTYPALTRIVLEINPVVVPQEVADHYQQERIRVMATRPREPSERLLHLMLFVAAWPDHPQWEVWMRAWNAQATQAGHPDWRYARVASFQRAVEDTQQRLGVPQDQQTTESEHPDDQNDQDQDQNHDHAGHGNAEDRA